MPGFLLAGCKRGFHIRRVRDNPHPFSTTAGRRLQQNRESDGFGNGDGFIRMRQDTNMPRHDRYASFDCQLLGCDLVSQPGDGRSRRADKHQSGLGQHVTESGIFR